MLAGSFAAMMLLFSPAQACEACNNLLARRLLGGGTPSAHAAG